MDHCFYKLRNAGKTQAIFHILFKQILANKKSPSPLKNRLEIW